VSTELSGYPHALYADAFTDLGVPRQLKRSGAWIIQRHIPGSPQLDAMGAYPLFVCPDWSGLASDLDEVGDDLVCVGLVTDPFGGYDEAYLQRCFPDLVRAFKDHFVVDLRCHAATVSRHHRREVRRALRAVSVEVCPDPMALAQDWIELYGALMQRHDVRGVSAFSPRALTAQLAVPGLVMMRAVRDSESVGALLSYVTGNVAYAHLAGYSDYGHSVGASYALIGLAIEYFAELGLHYLDLGAAAGVSEIGSEGLTFFKRGWTTETRTAYFCGRIFDHEAYQAICANKGIVPDGYFPAYRRGEFR
jgi:hypothetical protein